MATEGNERDMSLAPKPPMQPNVSSRPAVGFAASQAMLGLNGEDGLPPPPPGPLRILVHVLKGSGENP